MSETKHTPGPWVADDNEGFSMWKIYSRMSPSGSGVRGSRVADVIGDSAEADANARLIAAAPELLEALDSVVAIAKEAHAHWDADRDSRVGKILLALAGANEAYDNRIDWIHAAIAKAKGEVMP